MVKNWCDRLQTSQRQADHRTPLKQKQAESSEASGQQKDRVEADPSSGKTETFKAAYLASFVYFAEN